MARMKKYHKLIRDGYFKKMIDKEIVFNFHEADNKEYSKLLKKKLAEETEEYIKSENPKKLADLLEVIYAICKDKDYRFSEIELLRTEKLKKLGGFEKRIVLEECEED